MVVFFAILSLNLTYILFAFGEKQFYAATWYNRKTSSREKIALLDEKAISCRQWEFFYAIFARRIKTWNSLWKCSLPKQGRVLLQKNRNIYGAWECLHPPLRFLFSPKGRTSACGRRWTRSRCRSCLQIRIAVCCYNFRNQRWSARWRRWSFPQMYTCS